VADTFDAVAAELLEKKRRERKADRAIAKYEWFMSLARSGIGSRPITNIFAPAILRPIETRGRQETAKKLLGVIGQVFHDSERKRPLECSCVTVGRLPFDTTVLADAWPLRGVLDAEVDCTRRGYSASLMPHLVIGWLWSPCKRTALPVVSSTVLALAILSIFVPAHLLDLHRALSDISTYETELTA
jgi:hypothetical protein